MSRLPRFVLIASVVGLLALLLACGSGSPNPTAAPGGTAPTAGAPAAEAPTAGAPEAPTAAPEATAAPAIATVGQRVELDGIALTVTKVTRTGEIGKFQKAQDGREFIQAEVLVENVGAAKEAASYNPFYFKIKDSEGFESNATIDTGGTALQSGNLDAGGKARGTVVFDVAKGTKALVLSFQPPSMMLGQKSITVDLGDI